jgi:hypothetical protein
MHNIFIVFGVTLEFIKITKMCLAETYRDILEGIHFSDEFPVQNFLKQ